jgi:hypothetical protein
LPRCLRQTDRPRARGHRGDAAADGRLQLTINQARPACRAHKDKHMSTTQQRATRVIATMAGVAESAVKPETNFLPGKATKPIQARSAIVLLA